jgi:hypothetical protein
MLRIQSPLCQIRFLQLATLDALYLEGNKCHRTDGAYSARSQSLMRTGYGSQPGRTTKPTSTLGRARMRQNDEIQKGH